MMFELVSLLVKFLDKREIYFADRILDFLRKVRSVDFHAASHVAVSIELSDNGYVRRLCNRVLELHH